MVFARQLISALLILLCSNIFAQQRLAWYPIIGATPETSLILGAGGYYTLRAADSTTRTSFLNGNAMGTMKKQWMLGVSANYFTTGERYYVDADLSYVDFPMNFYGIGNGIDPDAKETYHSNTFRFQLLGYRSLAPKLFVGGGYRAGNVHRIQYSSGGILEAVKPIGMNGHYFSGVQLALLFDNRDNQLGASRGWYAKVSQAEFNRALGSQFNFRTQSIDVRTYVTPWRNRQDVLAFQVYGQVAVGDVPFTELSLMGSSTLMRGYYSGQYRDRYYCATQTEYRYKANSWLGFVAFVGAGVVAPRADQLTLSEVKPNYGGGARIAIMPSGNLTLRIDYGRGRDNGAFYIAIMEAF